MDIKNSENVRTNNENFGQDSELEETQEKSIDPLRDVKDEIRIKEEELDIKEEYSENGQLIVLMKEKFSPNTDFDEEIEIKNEPLDINEEYTENGQHVDQICPLNQSQTQIDGEKNERLQVKSRSECDSSRNDQRTENKDLKNDWDLESKDEELELQLKPHITMGSSFNLATLREHFKSEMEACHFLQEKNIIPKIKKCKNNHEMKLFCKGGNKIVWLCSKKICRYNISVRKGTWFEGTKLEFRTIILFIYCWCKEETSVKFCKEQFNISKPATVDYNSFLREVCAYSVINDCQPIGGENMIVEVEETYLSKRKNQKGRVLPAQWVFGGICRESKEIFLFAVPNRSEEKLLECIKQKIKPRTTIISDCFKSYINIDKIPGFDYKHIQVNHSQNFGDPITGAHTQNIENTLLLLKRRNKKHCGTHKQMLDSYLCEFVWRMKFAGKDLFQSMLKCISEFKLT